MRASILKNMLIVIIRVFFITIGKPWTLVDIAVNLKNTLILITFI